MDAEPPGPPSGPPAAPPGPPAAPPMDAEPPGPPGPPAAPPGPPAAPSVDLLAPLPPSAPLGLSAEEIPPPPGLESFPPPAPVEPSEPQFDQVNISEWDSNWEENWSEKARVFQPDNPKFVPESIQEEVDWKPGAPQTPVTKDQEALPSKSALNKMKKGELVDFAKGRGIDSSGTKKDIIERLHS